jgi:alpha-tubulin suppressor-like RCC1 family protein
MQETTSLIALCAIVLSAGCDPTAPPSNSLTIEDSPGATTWRAAGAGTYNSCAIDVDGAPYCWGFDLVDPCPTTSCTVLWVPTRFPAAAAPLKSVAVGATMACGVATDDNVYCWGEGLGVGTLGDGVTKKSRTPVRVALPGPAVQLTAGYSGECALLADATIWCWNESAVLPTKLDSQVRFAKLSTNYPACAIAENGDAYCWGGGYGRLGIGDADTDCQYGPSCLSTKVPLLVVGGHKWIDISVGSVSACGITTDHRAYCWGEMYPSFMDGPRGLLGAGSFIGSKSPLPVAGDLRFNSVAVGTRHACAVAIDNSAYCWGQNASGQLGVGFGGPNVASPQRVIGNLGFESLSVAEVTCGISVGKNLYCWGITYGGALGIGPSGPGVRATPTRTSPPAG